MNLSGIQFEELQQALLGAFPSRSALEQMVRFGLNQQLNQIAAEKSTTAEAVFALVTWAEAANRIDDLLQAARKANPGNVTLQNFADHFTNQAEREAPDQTTGQQGPIMTVSQRQRINTLQQHIATDQKLLSDYEEMLRGEDDPRRLLRYRREIDRQKEAIADYEAQLAGMNTDVALDADGSEPMLTQLQASLRQMQDQVQGMEDRLAAGQDALSQQMRNQQAALLTHIDAQHRASVEALLSKLDANQTEAVELLYDLADQQKLSQMEADDLGKLVRRAVLKLHKLPNATYWTDLLAAVEEQDSWQSRFKLTAPIVPGLLEYETEFSSELMPDVKDLLGQVRRAWKALRAKVKNNEGLTG